MNFKSITALGLVLSLLVGVQLADAASKKTSTISKKQLERLLKKSKSNKNAPTMVVKDGSKGGVQVVTEAQGKDKINSPAKAPKSDNKVSEPKVIKLADKKDAQAKEKNEAKTPSVGNKPATQKKSMKARISEIMGKPTVSNQPTKK